MTKSKNSLITIIAFAYIYTSTNAAGHGNMHVCDISSQNLNSPFKMVSINKIKMTI